MAQKFRAIVGRRAVVDRTVRADVVVIVAETPGDALGLEDVGQQFTVQALIPKTAVEALVDSILILMISRS